MQVHKEKIRYFWTKIHSFGVNCLKVSTDKEKQPNWDLIKIKIKKIKKLVLPLRMAILK